MEPVRRCPAAGGTAAKPEDVAAILELPLERVLELIADLERDGTLPLQFSDRESSLRMSDPCEPSSGVSERVEVYSASNSLADRVRRRLAHLTNRRLVRLSFDRPTLSLAFDDVPATAALAGAPLLERAGVRGTFYISAGLCDRESHMGRFAGAAEVRTLVAAGHEVGCHTYSHLDCGRARTRTIEADVTRNRKALAKWGLEAETFAYPYGEISGAAKRILATHFAGMRSVCPGVVAGEADLNALPAVGLEGPEGEARSVHWMEAASRRCAWLILFSHDVREAPSRYGCTPEALSRLLSRARTQGFEILPVREALAKGALASSSSPSPIGRVDPKRSWVHGAGQRVWTGVKCLTFCD